MTSADAANEKVRILLIEDEEMVLEIGEAMIRRMGHRVTLAADGKTAVRTVKGEAERFDLMLLDIGLPDMKAMDLFQEIKKYQPDIRVLICSGDTLSQEPRDLMAAGADGFIQKPYDYQALADAIGKVLPAA